MPYARNSDPPSSHEAARKMDPGSLHRRIVDALRQRPSRILDGIEWGGLTAEQLSDLLIDGRCPTCNRAHQASHSLSPRMKELWQMGLVMRSTQKRKNRSGVRAIIWLAVMPMNVPQ